MAAAALRPMFIRAKEVRRAAQNTVVRRFQTEAESRVRTALSRCHKFTRTGQPHHHFRTARASANLGWQVQSDAPGPRVHGAPNPIARSKHSRGPVAATALSAMITMTIAVKRVAQNNVILWCRTTEKSTMKGAIPSYCRKHRRVWRVTEVVLRWGRQRP